MPRKKSKRGELCEKYGTRKLFVRETYLAVLEAEFPRLWSLLQTQEMVLPWKILDRWGWCISPALGGFEASVNLHSREDPVDFDSTYRFDSFTYGLKVLVSLGLVRGLSLEGMAMGSLCFPEVDLDPGACEAFKANVGQCDLAFQCKSKMKQVEHLRRLLAEQNADLRALYDEWYQSRAQATPRIGDDGSRIVEGDFPRPDREIRTA